MEARVIFEKLFELHHAGIVHGDPRMQNIVRVPNGPAGNFEYKWIDFRVAMFDTFTPIMIGVDMYILISSIFFHNPSIYKVEEVISCRMRYQENVTMENMTSVYEACKKHM